MAVDAAEKWDGLANLPDQFERHPLLPTDSEFCQSGTCSRFDRRQALMAGSGVQADPHIRALGGSD